MGKWDEFCVPSSTSMCPPACNGIVRLATFWLSVLFLRSRVAYRRSIMGKLAEMRGTSTPTSSSLFPLVLRAWHAHVCPPITNVPSVVPRGRGPYFFLMPHKFCGVPVVNRQWGFPVSQNTLAALYLPGILQKRKSAGCSFLDGWHALVGV